MDWIGMGLKKWTRVQLSFAVDALYKSTHWHRLAAVDRPSMDVSNRLHVSQQLSCWS